MAEPSKLPPITDEMVLEWLAVAKAPQPWDLNALPAIVRNLDSLREQFPYQEEMLANWKPIHRAQRAINELRNALTSLTGSDEFKQEEAVWSEQEGGAADDFRWRTAAVHKMLSSLVDIDGSMPQQKPMVDRARDAYQFFQFLVPPPHPNKASREPGNPARLFVEQAVRAIGGNPPGAARLESILLLRDTAADQHEQTYRPVPFLEDRE